MRTHVGVYIRFSERSGLCTMEIERREGEPEIVWLNQQDLVRLIEETARCLNALLNTRESA
jgi:hypothetical protein